MKHPSYSVNEHWIGISRKNHIPQSVSNPTHKLAEAQNHRCAYCGKVMTYPTKDHIIPLSRGGTNTWLNTVAACFECNQAKKNFPAHSFFTKLNGGDVTTLYNDLLPFYTEILSR